MIGFIINLIPFAFLVTLSVMWIRALVKWDGIRRCDEQCDSCPFPQCQNTQKEEKK